MNNINPMIFNMLNGKDPKQAVMNMLQNQAKTNPIMENVLNMVNSNNMSGVEQIARNVCKSKGLDADKMFESMKQQFH